MCIRYLIKDLDPQIDEEVLKLSNSKQITQLKQWSNDLNRQVIQEKKIESIDAIKAYRCLFMA